MIEFVIAGLALGSVYALSAIGIVLTYVSSGVLNFAFASLAYFVARFYYWLLVQQHWSIVPAAVLSILVAGPLIGVLLWAVLFRFMRQSSTLVKVVSTIGVSVSFPAIASLWFGNGAIFTVQGLSPEPVPVYHLLGVAISLDQVIIYGCVAVVLIAGTAVLRYTEVGLSVRATVDSEAMAAISGIRPPLVAVSVWALSIGLAGLAGVLAAPIIGLQIETFSVLVAASFAAVIVARFRSLGVAFVTALLMGIATSIVEGYAPTSNFVSAAIGPSIPFVFIFLMVMYLIFTRRGENEGASGTRGPLDDAIAPQVSRASQRLVAESSRARGAFGSYVAPVVALIMVALLPLLLHSFWQGLVGLGLAYGVVFLSFSLVVGEGGMIWLCEITLAGFGAVATADLVTNAHWPFLGALVTAGLITCAIGIILGLFAIWLGDLYVALVTLTFGLLAENLIFTIPSIYNEGGGILVSSPGFASSARGFSWLVLVIFVILALATTRFRRSTAGLALGAVRWNQQAARTLGVDVVLVKLMVSGIAAFVAGVGGGLLAAYSGTATTASYETFTGLVWLAVVVTVGLRSNVAAALAGLTFGFIPALFITYLPSSVDQLPTVLFGLGAILVIRNPDGTVAMHARQLATLRARRRRVAGATEGIPAGVSGLEFEPEAVKNTVEL